MSLLEVSQEIDKALSAFRRGEISKEQLEEKRQELNLKIKGDEDFAKCEV